VFNSSYFCNDKKLSAVSLLVRHTTSGINDIKNLIYECGKHAEVSNRTKNVATSTNETQRREQQAAATQRRAQQAAANDEHNKQNKHPNGISRREEGEQQQQQHQHQHYQHRGSTRSRSRSHRAAQEQHQEQQQEQQDKNQQFQPFDCRIKTSSRGEGKGQ
jgi:hypothetical protein